MSLLRKYRRKKTGVLGLHFLIKGISITLIALIITSTKLPE